VRAEQADRRAPDPTINACVLLRSTDLAALRTKDEDGRPHLSDDPLPQITKIARRTATDVWRPSLDQHPSVDAWTPKEARTLLELAARDHPELNGPCLFQLSTGCRIGEALAMRWSAIDLGRGEITIRLKVHNNALGAPKTAASNRTIKIPQRLIECYETEENIKASTEFLRKMVWRFLNSISEEKLRRTQNSRNRNEKFFRAFRVFRSFFFPCFCL
jgi:integrase